MTIAQVIVSALGLVFSLVAAAGLGILGLFRIFGTASDLTPRASTLSVAWISLLAGVLAVPSLVFGIQRLRGKVTTLPPMKISGFEVASAAALIWPVVLLLGNFIAAQSRLAWLILPPLQLLAIGLPVWWIFEFTRRKLSVGSLQRGWGLLNFGIFITTPGLMILEIVVLIGLVVVFAVFVGLNPAMLQGLQELALQVRNMQGDTQAVQKLLLPYLQNPLVIFGVLALLSGLIPMLEELFKPLAIWALAGRQLTPAQGFVAGAVSGAAFALVESLFYLSTPSGEGWAALAVGRAGTCVLHITNTALMGWAMASAWKNGTYVRLGLTYLLACTLHGLWNGLSVLSGLAAFIKQPPANLQFLAAIAKVGPFGIVVLVVLLVILLWGSNRALRREVQSYELAISDPLHTL